MELCEQNSTCFEDDTVSVTAYRAFGISYLYPWQRIVIANIMDAFENFDGSEFANQIVLLPTGAGKSFCFLVPALLLKGATLVIYPLLALMSDQKRKMDEAGIESVIFKGGQSRQEREENFQKIKSGTKVIVANPEVLQNPYLLARLSECDIAHIAVDEAHCVSEWGDSFRPAYLGLGSVIRTLRQKSGHHVVVTAFTATASDNVLSRVCEVLFEGQAHIVRGDCDRPNIFYSVINCFCKKKEALRLAFTEQKPLIIFCGTRSRSEDMAREIAACYDKGKVRFYHAGLSREQKTSTEKWFFESEDGILCATCAYGMGVDKKNIRTVVHLEPSPTVESYVQEAGRAGRDGKESSAILLWSPEDTRNFMQNNVRQNDRSRYMAFYAQAVTCRRQILMKALGAENIVCSGCDVCRRGERSPFAQDAEFAFSYIRSHRKLYTSDELIQRLAEKFNEKDIGIFKINAWEHSDCAKILQELKEENLVNACPFPWKDKITVAEKKSEKLTSRT